MSDKDGKILRVKMLSGKIYGPYSKADVLKFIRLKKIRGEEEILFLEEGKWRPVSSEPDFFDQIQEVISGVKREVTKTKASIESGTKVKESSDVDLFEDLEEESKTKESQSPVTKTYMPFKDELSQLGESKQEPQDRAEFETNQSFRMEPNQSTKASSTSKKNAVQPKKSSPLKLVLILVIIAVFAYYIVEQGKLKRPISTTANVVPKINSQLNYFNVINQFLTLSEIDLNHLPKSKIAFVKGWSLPSGFGLHHWVEDLSLMKGEKNLYSNSAYWMRLAWNSLWIAQTLKVSDSEAAVPFETYGNKIVQILSEASAFSENQRRMIEVIELFGSGKWSKARSMIEPLAKDPVAAWMLDEISFLEFIDRGRQKTSKLYGGRYVSPAQDLQSKLRIEMLSGAKGAESLLEQLAEFDPQSFVGQLSAAEYFWRAHASGIPKAQQAFLSLLSVSALYPMSYQAIAWKEFSQFQSVFGREVPQKKATENFKLVVAGDIKSDKSFWDLGSQDLSVSNVSDQIVKKIERRASNLLDIAFLENLSFASKSSQEGLMHALYYAIFYKDWKRAERNTKLILLRNPSSVTALGAQVWINAANFKFDQAYEIHDRLLRSPNLGSEALKYDAIIYAYGREYQNAIDTLNKYLKAIPNDGMGHYFLARTYFDLEKNHDCVKAANLGRIHGRGAIRFLSELLYYRCRILAKLPLGDAIRELSRATKADPQNIFIAKEYILALYDSGKVETALDVAKGYAKRLPHAYQLKVLLGDLYQKQNSWDEALLFYNDARKVRPGATEATVSIADMFFEKKRYEEAAQNYLSAARADPDYPDLYLKAARSYRKAKQKYKALEYYKRELELRPSVLRTFLETAEFMLEANLPQQIPLLFQQYEDNFQGDPRVMLRLAQAYWAMQDVDNAEKTAKLALSQNNKMPEAYRILGRVYDRIGQYGLAKDNFEKYLHLLPQANDAAAIRAKLQRSPYN